jgi:PRTRC genetic system protein A
MTRSPWIGLYTRMADLEAGSEPIRWLATSDGVYEIRTTPIGTFRVKRPDADLDTCTEGLTLTIPRMPATVLAALIDRCRAALPHECLVNVYWHPARAGFEIDTPPQKADAVQVTAHDGTDPYDPQRPRVLQVHSHGTLAAFFSATDDADEQATGCYGVLGELDRPIPSMAWRFACGGRHVPLRTTDLFAL